MEIETEMGDEVIHCFTTLGDEDSAKTPPTSVGQPQSMAVMYLMKWTGKMGQNSPVTPFDPADILVSGVLSFIGILLTAVVDYWFLMRTFKAEDEFPVKMLIGSFGASAVLSFDAYTSPLAQPRNLVGGHLVCSFVGVCIRLFSEAVDIDYWVAGPLAVAVAVIGMRLARCVHPPGGATALIAVIGGPSVAALGFGYVLTCAGAAVISLAVAVVFNNMVPWRQYPTYWI